MTGQQIFNLLVEFFEEDQWDFQWVSGMAVLNMGFSGKNGKWMCYAQAREPEQQVVFYSVLPVNVPENRRQNVAEFITRANYGMVIGNFEMDYDDGEIRFKTSMDVEGFELLPPMIRQLVYANLVITDRYLPGIMRVMYSDDPAARVLEEIEADDFDDDDYFDGEDIDDEYDDDFDDDDDYDEFDDLDEPDNSHLN